MSDRPTSPSAETHTGGCVCGAVRFRAEIVPRLDACHCRICRGLVAGPFLAYGANELVVTAGEGCLSTYRSSEWAERQFCATCGANLFWRLRDGGHISIAAFALDAPPDGPLLTEIFVDEQPACYSFEGETVRMTGEDVRRLFAADEPGE